MTEDTIITIIFTAFVAGAFGFGSKVFFDWLKSRNSSIPTGKYIIQELGEIKASVKEINGTVRKFVERTVALEVIVSRQDKDIDRIADKIRKIQG